jgi:urease accessory protein
VALQRGDGAAELVFARRGPATALAHLYQHDPCRVLFPRSEPGDPVSAVVLTTSGGLAGGDRLRVSVAAQAAAAASVTSQAAEKVYRSLGDDCHLSATLEVGPEGMLEWLPQEAILFDGARLRRRTEAHVAPGGRLLACEMLVFGRAARGESYTGGVVLDTWRILRGDRLVWADALRLDGDVGAQLARPAAFDSAKGMATAIYVGDDAANHLEAAWTLLEGAEAKAGVTVVNGVLLARFLGRDAAAVRRDLVRYLGGLRHAVAGWPPRLPRVWHH